MTDSQDADDLDEFDDNAARIEHCVVFDGDRLHLTNVGLERFRERFARAGLDIRLIKTCDQLSEALSLSFQMEWERVVAQVAAKKPKSYRERIEREYLVAIALGNESEKLRLGSILDRLNALKLVRRTE